MRINQLLTESEQQQLQDLYEGPKFNKFGKAVGDIAGMAAKGVGAVAGGIAGAGSAIKKGFQAGKSRVAQGGDSPDAVIDPQKRTRAKAAPVGGTTPSGGGAAPAGGDAAAPAGKKPGFIAGLKAGLAGKPTPGKEQPAAGGGAAAPADNAAAVNAQGPAGTAPAKPQTGAAAAAMKKTADATAGANAEKAGQTVYAQVKSQINNLDKKGKQRILQLLQKSLQQAPAKGAAPAAQPAAAPAAQTAAPTGEPPPVKKRGGRKAAPKLSQAELDAEREAKMGPTSDSIIRTGNSLAETLMKAIAEEKRRMVAEGKISIFRVR